jgi:HK97 family phage major capsid protein
VKTNTGLLDGQRRWLDRQGIDPAELGRAKNETPAGGGTLTVPTTSDELEELLTDPVKLAAHAKAKTLPEVIAAYSRFRAQSDLDIKRQVNEQVTATLTDWLKENQPAGIDRIDLTPQAVRKLGEPRDPRNLYNPRAMGAVLDKEFTASDTGLADYMQTIWHGASNSADRMGQLGRIRAAFSSTVPSEGGFLIPEVLRSELLRISLETSIVRPRARVIPMESLRVPFPAIDSTSNASSVYGGIVGYWTEEGAALTVSQASFGRIVLDAKKLTAYTEVPNELMADSITSFQAFLDQIFPEALGFYEDDGFMNGNGVGMPLGFANAANAAIIANSAEAGQPATTIVWENIVKMFARMLPSSLGRAVWIASIDTFPELATMALSVGTGGSAIWLNNGQTGPPMTILGRPVIFTEKAPRLGSQGDISFVDLGMYLIGDRQVMSAMSSPHYKFQNDQTAYRIIERVDGRPWMQSAITPKNSGNTLSAFVQLAAR